MIGYTSAFIGTTITLTSFEKEFGLDVMLKSQRDLISENIVSLFIAGAFFGALLTYGLSHWIGRKWCLAIASSIFILGSGLQCGANGNRGLGILYAGRVLTGLGTGVASNIVPIYLSELAPPAIRGRLVGLYELGWQVGGMVGFWINVSRTEEIFPCPFPADHFLQYGVEKTLPEDQEQWMIPFAIQIIPSGMLLVGTLWLRESPRWLFLKDRRNQAMQNLCWIRQLTPTDIYITEEVAAIDQAHEAQKAVVGLGFWKPFQALSKRPNLMWRLFVGCMLFFWQNGSGINAINYYSPTIFSVSASCPCWLAYSPRRRKLIRINIRMTGNANSSQSIGVQSDTVNIMTGIFGVIKAVMTIFWLLFLVDQLGRRKLLLIGGITGSVCMWVIAAYIYIVEPTEHKQDHLTGSGIAAIFFFYLWTAVYTPTWNGTPWVINSVSPSQA